MSEFWLDRRVFITGATGIVGCWLVKELLDRGASVVVLIRDADPQSELFRSGDIHRTSVVNGALEDFSTLDRAINQYEVDTVFHLGAQAIVGLAHRFPLATFESNIRGTYNVLEACRLHRSTVRRVLVASSDKAYGQQPKLPYTEDMPLNGRHPYEVSKSCADLIAQSYYHTYGSPVGIARFANVYGGGDLNWSRIIPGTIRSLLRGEGPIIRSDGRHVRDYIYVKDVAHAYMRLAEALEEHRLEGQAFNFGCEAPINVLQLIETIQGLMDCQHLVPEVQDQAEGEISIQYLSSAKAQDVLGWQAEYPLEAGLHETITWYRRFLSDKGPQPG